MIQNAIKKTEYSLFMKYSVFVLLFSSLAYMTLFPYLIKGYNLIATLLLISVILLRFKFLIVTKIGVVFLFLAAASFIIYYKASLGSFGAFVVSILVAITAFNLRRKEVELFVKAYINMIFIFAIASILGFVILYIFPFGEGICQQTIKIDFDSIDDYRLYNFPCYLGLSEIRFTGGLEPFQIVDFDIFGGYSRGSSFSSEPGNAGFFMVPAFIFLLFSPKDQAGIKEKIKLYVITFSLVIVIVSFLTIVTIFSLYILKILVNSKSYKGYLFILMCLIFIAGFYGHNVLIYLKQYYIFNEAPYILTKFLVNSFYLKNLVYFLIPIYFLTNFLIIKTRSYIARNHYYSIYFLLSIFSYFIYILKNPDLGTFYLYVVIGFFQYPSFWLWCALYICVISIRFNKSNSY
jgi:hypothetical protein